MMTAYISDQYRRTHDMIELFLNVVLTSKHGCFIFRKSSLFSMYVIANVYRGRYRKPSCSWAMGIVLGNLTDQKQFLHLYM